MWKVTAFLSRINKLPPAVREYWQDTFNVGPQAGGEEKGNEENASPKK
jgi:hypothetical protein